LLNHEIHESHEKRQEENAVGVWLGAFQGLFENEAMALLLVVVLVLVLGLFGNFEDEDDDENEEDAVIA
jgi:hypothetical protein